VGSPEQCAEVIVALGAGIDHFVLDINRHGYEPLSFAIDQLDSCATEVIPLLG
jgi:hypothetical protein